MFLAVCLSLAPSFGQAEPARVTPPPILEPDVLAFPPAEAAMGMNIGPVSRRDIDTLPDSGRFDTADGMDAFEIIPIPQILFPHNEITLSAEAVDILSKAAKYIQDNQLNVARVLVNGHADEVASFDFNNTLSDERAYGVSQFLTAAGVDPQLLHASGSGESQPVDENWTRAGRARNRRVEVYILLSRPALP